MRRWRASGWPRWAMRSPRRSRNWIGFSRRRCRSWRRAFPSTARIWPRRACWPTPGLNDYIAAGDRRRPRFIFVERAGRGADLRLLWRGLSRPARGQAGSALSRQRPHQIDPAGVLAHPLSQAVVGDDQDRGGEEQSGPVSGGRADAPGVGVQPLGHLHPKTPAACCNCCLRRVRDWRVKRA